MIPMVIRSIAIPLVTFAAIGAFASSCPSNPVSPTVPDAGVEASPVKPAIDATTIDCQTACDAMKRVGCVVLSDCAAVMCKVNADPRFAHYNLGCLVKALVPSDVAACGADCKLGDR